MSQYALRVFLYVCVVSGLFSHACAAAQLQLNIKINLDGRNFLIANQQKITIALASPASADDAAVVAAMTLQPIADTTQIVFDPAVALYLTYWPVTAFDILGMALQSPVVYGQAYSFNGVQINGNGNGLRGYVSIYYDAPLNSQPVVTGLAWFIYDITMGKPSTPSPVNYYTLNRFETRVITQSAPIVWVFVASGINTGSVLPLSILKPVTPPSSNSNSEAAVSGSNSVVPQIGRYLSVNVDPSTQATIHFDLASNAFADGPYPTEK